MQSLDCIGLVVCTSMACGVDGGDFRVYGPEPDPETLIEEAGKRMLQLPTKADICAGSVVVFKLKLWGLPQHFGILTHRKTVIHTYADIERVAECGFDKRWRRLVTHAFNLRGIDYTGAPKVW